MRGTSFPSPFPLSYPIPGRLRNPHPFWKSSSGYSRPCCCYCRLAPIAAYRKLFCCIVFAVIRERERDRERERERAREGEGDGETRMLHVLLSLRVRISPLFRTGCVLFPQPRGHTNLTAPSPLPGPLPHSDMTNVCTLHLTQPDALPNPIHSRVANPFLPPVEPSHMPCGRADNDSFHGVSGCLRQLNAKVYPLPLSLPSLSPSLSLWLLLRFDHALVGLNVSKL